MSATIKALVVDDERLARKRLKELLQAHPEVTIVGEADTIEAAAEMAASEKPDVIFLDVQMPPRTGFDLLSRLEETPKIVFVTAHDRFAVRAFEANALDYLLKPVHPARLAESLRRLHAGDALNEASKGRQSKLEIQDFVALRDRGHLIMTEVRRIVAIAAEGAYSRVFVENKGSMLILRNIGEWEERLPSPPFLRIDRSLILNLGAIREAEVKDRDHTDVSLAGVETPLVLGRAASLRLRKALDSAE